MPMFRCPFFPSNTCVELQDVVLNGFYLWDLPCPLVLCCWGQTEEADRHAELLGHYDPEWPGLSTAWLDMGQPREVAGASVLE